MRHSVVARVLRLFKSGQRHLHFYALRVVRAMITSKDTHYHRHIVKYDLLKPVMENLKACAKKDNLVTSAIIDLIELIRVEGMRILIEYLIEKYSSILQEVQHVDTYPKLRLKYEQITESSTNLFEPDANASQGASGSGSGGIGAARGGVKGAISREEEEEESYFDSDSDDVSSPVDQESTQRRQYKDTNMNAEDKSVASGDPLSMLRDLYADDDFGASEGSVDVSGGSSSRVLDAEHDGDNAHLHRPKRASYFDFSGPSHAQLTASTISDGLATATSSATSSVSQDSCLQEKAATNGRIAAEGDDSDSPCPLPPLRPKFATDEEDDDEGGEGVFFRNLAAPDGGGAGSRACISGCNVGATRVWEWKLHGRVGTKSPIAGKQKVDGDSRSGSRVPDGGLGSLGSGTGNGHGNCGTAVDKGGGGGVEKRGLSFPMLANKKKAVSGFLFTLTPLAIVFYCCRIGYHDLLCFVLFYFSNGSFSHSCILLVSWY